MSDEESLIDALIDKGHIDDMYDPLDVEHSQKGEQHDQDSNESSDDFESDFFEEYA